jgi:hypothetical protein
MWPCLLQNIHCTCIIQKAAPVRVQLALTEETRSVAEDVVEKEVSLAVNGDECRMVFIDHQVRTCSCNRTGKKTLGYIVLAWIDMVARSKGQSHEKFV